MTQHNHDKEKTDEAWARLQEKLNEEPINSSWAEWAQKAEQTQAKNTEDPYEIHTAGFTSIADSELSNEQAEHDNAAGVHPQKARRSNRRGMSRRRKWTTAIAGVAAFAVILATPVGNTAMASLLNQFRMQNVTVVNEEDLRSIFYQMSENGDVRESINTFGTFTSTSGTIDGELHVNKIQELLGYTPINSVLPNGKDSVYISSSQEVTLNLNVEEVNKAMKRLGAVQLLPESVDGKPITLRIPETVNYNLSSTQEHWASLSQMNTPVITVDPSIKVEEALEAVINFPLLPEHLKTSLQQSRILSGEIPMPLITGDNTEQIIVGSTPVIIDYDDYSQGPIYNATWVQNGQLFQFQGGDVYQNKEKFMAKLQEIIQL